LIRQIPCVCLLLGLCAPLIAQDSGTKKRPEDLPTGALLSAPGPTFRVRDLNKAPRVIVYGDQRFTDPSNTEATNPTARKLLVARIAEDKPDAVLLNGDVPYSGEVVDDYQVYANETKMWRDEQLHVYPALGNHEFHGDPQQALEHWWTAFPAMRNRRWYSVQLGKAIYTIALDSDASLLTGSDQLRWIDGQLKGLLAETKFVFISMHHPPVADFQTRINVSHNPRPNEIALRDYLESIAPRLHAKIIVCAGHIHNYERFQRGDVTYLVSGGGGAKPVPVERGPEDLYQSTDFPNYHYVDFILHGNHLDATMYRLANVDADSPTWEIRDRFSIDAK